MTATTLTAPSLRGYQVDAVKNIAAHLATGGRCQLRAACGTGKTLTALRVAENVMPHSGLAVVLAPTIGLVAQTLEAWQRDAACPFTEAAVCSDTTVRGHEGSERVSTSPDVIATWVRQPGRKVIASTYASAPAVATALRQAGAVANLLVCDEAHRLAGRPDRSSTVVLDEGQFPARRRLFLTATPRLCFNPDSPGISMDDETLFGRVLCDYPFARAIADGWLDDYRIAVIGVPDHDVRALLADDGERDYVDASTRVSLRMIAAQAALARAAAEYGIRRALSFHSRVDAAAQFARTFNGAVRRLPPGARPTGPCEALHVSGEMPANVREQILGRLAHPREGGWTVVANARCLTEGIDIPAIDAVLFASPRESVTDIAQAAGRALRRHAGGTGTATIIIPVLVPGDGDLDLESGAYETVWRVVRAMREHDEALATGLDFARSHWAQAGGIDGGREVLPARVSVTVPGAVGDRLVSKLSLAIVQHATARWWDGYEHAAEFHTTVGHLAVPRGHVCGHGYKLGNWIGKARQAHAKGVLPPERVKALDELGMIWDAQEAVWETGFAAAAVYRKDHGHLLVPRKFQTADGFNLGGWVKNQRARHREGLLGPARVERLDELGMCWEGNHAAQRARALAYAAGYRQEHGDLDVPLRYQTPDGFHLGRWLHLCRAQHHDGALHSETVKALESLGVRWWIRTSPKRTAAQKAADDAKRSRDAHDAARRNAA